MSPEIRAALDSVPAIRYPEVLRALERGTSRVGRGGGASLVLGQLLFARGEYGAAADAFARAAARLDPAQRNEARYGSGLCALALRSPNAARAALEEIPPTSLRRPDALFAIALAWEMAERPDRALETLQDLTVTHGSSAVIPAALERLAALAEKLHRPDLAQRTRSRLVAEYPRSLEAAATVAVAVDATGGEPASGSFTVESGNFRQEPRALALSARAARSGFPRAEVVSHGEGAMRTYTVRLGVYSSAVEAAQNRELASRSLGVTARVSGGK